MATIYQKTVSDKTCILAPREFILRPFDFQLWTEMRMGIYFSMVAASGDATDCSTESVAVSTAADRIAYGIKDSASNDLPGFGSSLYLGALTPTGDSSDCTQNGTGSVLVRGDSHYLAAGGYYGTTLVGGTTGQALGTTSAGFMRNPFNSGSAATGYCGFCALKFVINNRGLATQTIDMSWTMTEQITGTDYSAQALRLLINNATYFTPVNVAWNDGAIARTIPDAIYVRMPFYSNRIRMSAIRAIRYAP